MMKKMTGILMLGAALCVPLQMRGQPNAVSEGGAGAASHGPGRSLEAQKLRLDEQLKQRIMDIEKRFTEEQAFRVKMKEERLGLEKKLVQERKVFLDSIQTMNPEERQAAWSAFFKKVREKRDDYNAQHRAQSKKFWEARAQKRQSYGKTVQYGAAH